MIDLNDMAVFARVVEHNSFSGAARYLGMPKSTVSRRISQLESRLGVRLLQRTTRQIQLTDAGSDFYQRCSRVVEEAEEAQRSLSHTMAAPRGRLRITAPVEFGQMSLTPLINGYLKEYPEVELDIELTNRRVDLIEEGYDLAIRAGQLDDSTLVARSLGQSRLVVCASPAYLAKFGRPSTPQQLKQHKMLLYSSQGQRTTFRFGGLKGIVNLQLESYLRSNHLLVLLAAAVDGLGVTILPEHHCREEIQSGALELLLEDWPLERGGIYAVYPSPRHLTPKVRSFLDYIVSQGISGL